MSDTLRRIYNAVDLIFDRGAISKELHFSRNEGESRNPKTALQAFKSIQPFVLELDRQARLKMIVSQQGVNVNGTSLHWEFFFDLVQRRAQLVCDWVLPWDEAMDDYGTVSIEFVVKPFPTENSPIRQMVRDGKLLHQQMIGMWKQEYRRRPNLPDKFRDTDAALADFVQQGLNINKAEFSLSTGQSPEGRLCWIAQTKRDSYFAAVE
jgi:hypothetical protein